MINMSFKSVLVRLLLVMLNAEECVLVTKIFCMQNLEFFAVKGSIRRVQQKNLETGKGTTERNIRKLGIGSQLHGG